MTWPLAGSTWPLLFVRNLFRPEDFGGNRYPFETMRRFGERGHRVRVITGRIPGAYPSLRNVDYRFYPVSRRTSAVTHVSNLFLPVPVLRQERGRWPVVMSGSYEAPLALRLAGVVPRTPLVFLYHGEFYSEWVQALGHGWKARARRAFRDYMAAQERAVYRISARIVAVSQFSAGEVVGRLPSAESRIRVVPTGVDTSFFTPAADRSAVRRALGLPEEGVLLLGVGRLAGVKQFDRLIQAYANAFSSDEKAHLVLAGDGPERPRLQALVKQMRLEERVTLAGFCDPPRLRAFLQAADLQVCSSAFENFSLAILEGFSSGLPVLGTPGGGTPELVGQLDESLVLASDSVADIRSGLLHWTADRDRLARLGQDARRLAAERYDWERVVDGLEAVCEEVMGT